MNSAPTALRVIRINVWDTDTVKQQLNAQDIHIAGHATASLERSRQAILQLGAANILTVQARRRCEKRFRGAVREALQTYVGGRYQVVEFL